MELAVCLPVLVLLVFGSIEACNMIFLRQALNASAYEGVRVAIGEDAVNQQVIDRCQLTLDARGVAGTTITIDPPDVTTVQPGDPITITVSAQCDANSVGPAWFFANRNLAGRASFVKE